MPTKQRMPSRKYYLSSQHELKLNYYEKYYRGSCETTFKKQFANHKESFDNEQYKNETELSKEVWNLKVGLSRSRKFLSN